jgi:hypothetical protein
VSAVPGLAVLSLALLVACGLAAAAGTDPAATIASPAGAGLAQISPGEPREATFTWTLYPRMWAEIDLRMAADAEAVADVTVEGGEIGWNLHTHPPDSPPEAWVTLEAGRAARVTVRCAPLKAGWYSYLFTHDAGADPVRLRVTLRLVGEARVLAIRP